MPDVGCPIVQGHELQPLNQHHLYFHLIRLHLVQNVGEEGEDDEEDSGEGDELGNLPDHLPDLYPQLDHLREQEYPPGVEEVEYIIVLSEEEGDENYLQEDARDVPDAAHTALEPMLQENGKC